MTIAFTTLFLALGNLTAEPSALFSYTPSLHTYDFDLTLTTVGGKSRNVPGTLSRQQGKDSCELLIEFLDEDGWVVDRVGDTSIKILGLTKAGGENGSHSVTRVNDQESWTEHGSSGISHSWER